MSPSHREPTASVLGDVDLVLVERDVALDVLGLLVGLRVVPRGVGHHVVADLERIVARLALRVRRRRRCQPFPLRLEDSDSTRLPRADRVRVARAKVLLLHVAGRADGSEPIMWGMEVSSCSKGSGKLAAVRTSTGGVAGSDLLLRCPKDAAKTYMVALDDAGRGAFGEGGTFVRDLDHRGELAVSGESCVCGARRRRSEEEERRGLAKGEAHVQESDGAAKDSLRVRGQL